MVRDESATTLRVKGIRLVREEDLLGEWRLEVTGDVGGRPVSGEIPLVWSPQSARFLLDRVHGSLVFDAGGAVGDAASRDAVTALGGDPTLKAAFERIADVVRPRVDEDPERYRAMLGFLTGRG